MNQYDNARLYGIQSEQEGINRVKNSVDNALDFTHTISSAVTKSILQSKDNKADENLENVAREVGNYWNQISNPTSGVELEDYNKLMTEKFDSLYESYSEGKGFSKQRFDENFNTLKQMYFGDGSEGSVTAIDLKKLENAKGLEQLNLRNNVQNKFSAQFSEEEDNILNIRFSNIDIQEKDGEYQYEANGNTYTLGEIAKKWVGSADKEDRRFLDTYIKYQSAFGLEADTYFQMDLSKMIIGQISADIDLIYSNDNEISYSDLIEQAYELADEQKYDIVGDRTSIKQQLHNKIANIENENREYASEQYNGLLKDISMLTEGIDPKTGKQTGHKEIITVSELDDMIQQRGINLRDIDWQSINNLRNYCTQLQEQAIGVIKLEDFEPPTFTSDNGISYKITKEESEKLILGTYENTQNKELANALEGAVETSLREFRSNLIWNLDSFYDSSKRNLELSRMPVISETVDYISEEDFVNVTKTLSSYNFLNSLINNIGDEDIDSNLKDFIADDKGFADWIANTGKDFANSEDISKLENYLNYLNGEYENFIYSNVGKVINGKEQTVESLRALLKSNSVVYDKTISEIVNKNKEEENSLTAQQKLDAKQAKEDKAIQDTIKANETYSEGFSQSVLMQKNIDKAKIALNTNTIDSFSSEDFTNYVENNENVKNLSKKEQIISYIDYTEANLSSKIDTIYDAKANSNSKTSIIKLVKAEAMSGVSDDKINLYNEKQKATEAENKEEEKKRVKLLEDEAKRQTALLANEEKNAIEEENKIGAINLFNEQLPIASELQTELNLIDSYIKSDDLDLFYSPKFEEWLNIGDNSKGTLEEQIDGYKQNLSTQILNISKAITNPKYGFNSGYVNSMISSNAKSYELSTLSRINQKNLLNQNAKFLAKDQAEAYKVIKQQGENALDFCISESVKIELMNNGIYIFDEKAEEYAFDYLSQKIEGFEDLNHDEKLAVYDKQIQNSETKNSILEHIINRYNNTYQFYLNYAYEYSGETKQDVDNKIKTGLDKAYNGIEALKKNGQFDINRETAGGSRYVNAVMEVLAGANVDELINSQTYGVLTDRAKAEIRDFASKTTPEQFKILGINGETFNNAISDVQNACPGLEDKAVQMLASKYVAWFRSDKPSTDFQQFLNTTMSEINTELATGVIFSINSSNKKLTTKFGDSKLPYGEAKYYEKLDEETFQQSTNGWFAQPVIQSIIEAHPDKITSILTAKNDTEFNKAISNLALSSCGFGDNIETFAKELTTEKANVFTMVEGGLRLAMKASKKMLSNLPSNVDYSDGSSIKINSNSVELIIGDSVIKMPYTEKGFTSPIYPKMDNGVSKEMSYSNEYSTNAVKKINSEANSYHRVNFDTFEKKPSFVGFVKEAKANGKNVQYMEKIIQDKDTSGEFEGDPYKIRIYSLIDIGKAPDKYHSIINLKSFNKNGLSAK